MGTSSLVPRAYIGPKLAHPRDGAAEKRFLACPSTKDLCYKQSQLPTPAVPSDISNYLMSFKMDAGSAEKLLFIFFWIIFWVIFCESYKVVILIVLLSYKKECSEVA